MDFADQIYAKESRMTRLAYNDVFSDRRSGSERRDFNSNPVERRCRRTSIRSRRTQHHFENTDWWLQRNYVDSDILVLHSETVRLVPKK